MSTFRIVHGDVVARASLFVDNYFDACLCDPPYLLQFMGEEFDKQHLELKGKNEGQKMQAWHERWTREVLRVLKPGAHMLAFGGTRTYHRLASAAEDAGFEVKDMLEWIYGQGFPKGKTKLKPAQEPLLLAGKKGSKYLNIDECRLPASSSYYNRSPNNNRTGSIGDTWNENNCGYKHAHRKPPHEDGRWPANLILSHHEACNEVCHLDCPVRILDEQSGITKSTASGYNFEKSSNSNPSRVTTNIKSGVHFGDSGGASRFFYCAKVSRRERNLGGIDCRHPTLKPIALTTYLARLLLPPPHLKSKPVPRRLLIPFSGAGSEIIGALFAGWGEVWGIEQNPEYIADAEARIAARHTLKVTK